MLQENKNNIAVWVAQVANRKIIDKYLKENYSDDDAPLSPFAADLKSWYDHDFMESYFIKGKGKSVSDVLDPCSYSASFIESAEAAARKKKIKEANVAILFYGQEYKGKRWPSKSPVKFLGNFSFSTKPVVKESALAQIKGHTKTRVGPVRFSSDDKLVVTCGFDGTVITWDSESGKPIAQPKALTDGISSFNILCLTSDKRCLVSNISNTFVQTGFPDKKCNWKKSQFGLSEISENASFGVDYETVMNLTTGKRSKHQPKDIYEVSVFVDDENLLLWTEAGKLRLWNARTGKSKWSTDVSEYGTPYDISVSPCATLAAACIEGSGYVFELKKGKQLSSFSDEKSRFRQIQFAGSDTFVVIDYKGVAQSRSVKTGRSKKMFERPRTIYWSGGLNVSANGKFLSLIETKYRLLDVWRVRDGKHIGRYQAKKNKSRHLIDTAAFSNDGKTIVVGEFEGDVVFVRNCKDGLDWV